ncbi:MAG: DUF881 domain-containing protein [Clostridia bacterium]|nr:DUF881 domain-containing protein [Clostridia bacterium]
MSVRLYRNIALTLVCIILGVVISWQYRSINYNEKMASSNNKRLEDITDELIAEKKKVEDLKKRNEELILENIEFERTRGNISEETKKLYNELERVRMVAGLVKVKGKGIVITIDSTDEAEVLDDDILSVINELRASDAQAISINNERLVAMSEVRAAGKYIMVNQRQMLPPFEIKAIADPDKLERALRIMDGVIEKLEEYELKVKIEKSEEVVIPGVRDDGTVIKNNLLTPVKDK